MDITGSVTDLERYFKKISPETIECFDLIIKKPPGNTRRLQ
jgi:hypothetical protein